MPKLLVLIMLTLISIILSCREDLKVIENWKGYEMVTVVQEPCLRFVHPVWVDEESEEEWEFEKNYSNYHHLNSFIKNTCGDTVRVALRKKYGAHQTIHGSY